MIWRRGEPQHVEVPEVEQLEDLMEKLVSRRFPRLSEAVAMDGVKLDDLALRRLALLLRQELHRGNFGVLRFATVQGSGGGGGVSAAIGRACRIDHSGLVVACLLPITVDMRHCAAVLLEARLLASMTHASIVNIAGVCLDERPFVLAVEDAEAVSEGGRGEDDGVGSLEMC